MWKSDVSQVRKLRSSYGCGDVTDGYNCVWANNLNNAMEKGDSCFDLVGGRWPVLTRDSGGMRVEWKYIPERGKSLLIGELVPDDGSGTFRNVASECE